MKPPALTRSDLMAGAEARVHSSCIAPKLENRILMQASSVPSLTPAWAASASSISSACPALQPSFLSSTQLKQDLFLIPSLSSSIHSPSSVLSAGERSAGGHSPGEWFTGERCLGERSAVERRPGERSAGGLSSGPGVEKERKRTIEQDRQRFTEDGRSCREELTEDVDHEDPADPLPLSEMPVLELRLSKEREKWTIEPDEEFGELETDSGDEEADLLKDKKYKLLNMVCCSLVNKSCSPGQEGWDEKKRVWRKIRSLAEDITRRDAEFLLKVAVYTRQELKKHLMASYLLALAAYLPASKPHVRRYFCAAVRLPSDWLQVPRIYSTCFSSSLPTCLKKALVDKFKQFSEGQLAKYCTRQQRKPKTANNSPELCKKWAELLRSDSSTLQKQLQKKKSEFSMQNLIKCLHIKEPAELVMGLLGKKYPADVKAFEVSGLSGAWQSDRAGQRMKLKQLDTWQTTLSREGNKAATWEKLIDSNSLPFVVMLKNLRNIITQGISTKHHDKILKRLTSESAVIQSKLLPLRFLAAYKVMTDLRKFADAGVKVDSSKAVLQAILNRFKRSKRFQYMQWSSEGRRRLRVTMRVPFVYRLYSARRRLLQRASQRKFGQELLERYLQALLKAVQLSCTYNIPLIPGHTLICISNFSSGASWYEHFCPPADPSDNSEETAGSQLATVPLAMMLKYGCENSQVLITNSMDFQEADLSTDSFLDGVRDTVKLLEDSWNNEPWTSYINTFSKLSEKNMKLDNIILMTAYFMEQSLECELDKYRKKSSSDALVVNVNERPDKDKTYETRDPHTVYLFNISKEILRFVSERGSSRLLDHVELIDKLYDIPPPAGGREKPGGAADMVPLPVTPALRWREVRVFISSAWRGMCAERDALVRSVFPELRRRLAPHRLYLREVELCRGVTEEEFARAVELCLAEAGRSQLMLGILGERYGPVVHRPALTNLPQGSWLDSAPSDLSITEMEIRHFQSSYPDSAQSRMLFYFRSPQLVGSVPVAWRADFTAESRESEAKLSDLKEWIRKNDFRVTENYPCEWAGVVDGRPSVKGLEEFAKAVMEDLWAALQELYVEEVDEAGLINQQEMHQEAQRRHFHGGRKLVSMAMGKVRECQRKGGILLVEGRPGEGKTAFMAAMAHALSTPACDVISYSIAANQSAGSVSHFLRCVVQMLRKRKEEEQELAPSISYRALLSEFHLHLAEPREGPLLVLLVDGADLVHDARGQVVSEWIPEHLPKGVCLVLSVTPASALRNTLSRKKCCVLFPLGELPWPDCCEILQKELGVYGKEWSDSASSKQLQTLLMKKGAGSLLYLRLACEELRNHSSFQEIKDRIQALPQSLCELVQHTLLRLQAQFGAARLDWALAALTVSSAGLRERDLHALLNLCSDLGSTQRPPTWQETLQMARNPRSQVPTMVLCQLTLNLRRLIQPSGSRSPDELLALTNKDIRSAFQKCYVSTEEDLTRAHLILAAHLWVRSDPQENDTFIHCDADALSHLLTHLMKCGQWGPVRFLLSSYYFLYANVRHGLLRPLLESFTWFSRRDRADRRSPEPTDDADVRQCEDFLKRHAPLLSQWPALFVQQALNEAGDSPARVWAERIVQRGGVRPLKWLNNSGHTPHHQAGELVSSLSWDPSCLAVSPGGVFFAAGTEKGTLHIFLSDTRQEVKSLVSTCDGISGCIFLEECVVCITSYSGQVEVWDFHSGCRTARLDAHSRRITGCDISSDRKHFATVSLDFSLKVWLTRGLQQVVSLLQPSPPNCVTLEPAGALVAVGCWDGAVRVWDWTAQQNCKVVWTERCGCGQFLLWPACGTIRLTAVLLRLSVF
ncbi:telomerase protein component 1-like isoform X2 [Salminus brasiliensis]|uniref:telomerase protein component 1-like isoform X2 n=1 Tax=Salminus brasiliensis TaxID=930266 RepID=UPI003B83322D